MGRPGTKERERGGDARMERKEPSSKSGRVRFGRTRRQSVTREIYSSSLLHVYNLGKNVRCYTRTSDWEHVIYGIIVAGAT